MVVASWTDHDLLLDDQALEHFIGARHYPLYRTHDSSGVGRGEVLGRLRVNRVRSKL